MTSKHLTAQLQRQLEMLPFHQSIDFGLNICQRLLPDYISFYLKNIWGDPETLKEAIVFCEISKLSQEVDRQQVDEYRDAVAAITPDTEDFGDWDGSYALNAACAVYELLGFLNDKDKARLIDISIFMTDTIDFKIQEEDETDEDLLLEHPMILDELHYQLKLTKPN